MNLLRIGVVGALLAPYAAVFAQGLSTIDFVKGNYGKYASVMKLNDLPDDYSAVHLSIASTPPDAFSTIGPFMGLGRYGSDPSASIKVRLAQAYWTNGDTVRAVGKEFLVTYRIDVDLMELLAGNTNPMTGDMPKPKLQEPPLKISLVSLDSIQSVSPCPELTKRDLVVAFGNAEWLTTSPERVAAAETATLSNVKQAALGLIMYQNDWDDYLPYTQSSKATWYVVYPYVKNLNVFKSFNPKGSMLRFNMGVSGALASSIASPAETVLIYDAEPWPDGRRAVAFCDGHAKLVNAETWADLTKHLAPAGIQRVKKPLPVSYDKEFDKVVQTRSGPPRAAAPSGQK